MHSAQNPRRERAGFNRLSRLVAVMLFFAAVAPIVTSAQVPSNIEEGLLKIGHIVDPICTSRLYRPLMPANDINSNVTPLSPKLPLSAISLSDLTRRTSWIFLPRTKGVGIARF